MQERQPQQRDNSLSSSSDEEARIIRSRLLNKLGIHSDEYISKSTPVATAAEQRRIRMLRHLGVGHSTTLVNPPDGSVARNPFNGALPHFEPLKQVRPSSLRRLRMNRANRENGNKEGRHVIFHDEVSVIDIPMRSEYSKRIRSCMWNSLSDLNENMERNSTEFAAEGWNWESVLEDEGMYIDATSGELVHPVHVEQ